MDRIHYAGETLVTGTNIASALLDYAHALARRNASETVDVPIRREDGSLGTAKFLIGPSSQLVSETIEFEGDELIDEEVVARFVAASRSLEGVRSMPVATSDYSAEGAEDLDLPADAY